MFRLGRKKVCREGGILFYIDVESLLLEEGWAIRLPGTGAADRVTKMLRAL